MVTMASVAVVNWVKVVFVNYVKMISSRVEMEFNHRVNLYTEIFNVHQ